MIEFNGEFYRTKADWARAYPAYGNKLARHVVAGAKTVLELEIRMYQAQQRSRAGAKVGQAALRKEAARKVLRA